MKTLVEITNGLAAAVESAEPSDKAAFAAMQADLAAMDALLKQLPGTHAEVSNLLQAAAATKISMTQLLTQDVQDAARALDQMRSTIGELQKLARQHEGAKTQSDSQAAGSAEFTISAEDLPLVQEFVTEAMGHGEAAEAAILKLEENPQDTAALDAIFRSFHTVKGVAGFLHLEQIGELAHTAENMLNLIRKGQSQLNDAAIDLVLDSIDLMKTMIVALDEAARNGKPILRQERLPALLERLRCWIATPTEVAATPTVVIADSSPAVKMEGSPRPQTSQHNAANHEKTVRVSTERLDALINMVGELVIAQSMVSQDVVATTFADPQKARNMAQLGKITRELQELSMAMRMVPIHSVFQKMARVARDLAHKAGKEIDFSAIGGETEIDRNLIETLSDPLIHMVRNAVDHGLETIEARTKAGKNACGKLELKAYHQGGNIVVEVTDDGRGLNAQRIKQKALEAGIITEGHELTEQETFKLILQAGLSTAEKVTEVSGRGVGMDVVRRNVEALRGRIDISSVQGQGSTFTVRLPLTLAVIDGLVVKVGTQRYILPMTGVQQNIRPTAAQISTIQGRGEMCTIRDAVLPLFRLHILFDVVPTKQDPTEAIVVIIQDRDRRCCLLVDELVGQQQVVIKSLGDAFGAIPGVSGGAILGDGNVNLILDVPGLIDLAVQ